MKLSQPTRDAKERIKQSKKEQKETNMSNKKTIIATVAVTLAIVAAVAAVFYCGTQYQVHLDNQIVTARAQAVAELKADTK